MKRIVSMLIAIIFLLNTALGYTTTIRAKGIGVVVTSGEGNVVTVKETAEDITGWEVIPDTVEFVNNEFTMPSENVQLNAVVKEITAPTLATSSGAWYTQGGTSIAKTSITSIALMPTYTPGTVVESWDASSGQAGTITAYVEDDGSGAGTYKVTLAGNGANKMLAETSCSNVFRGFSGVTSISGLDILDTTNVSDMLGMFYECNNLINVDVSGFNTSEVTNMGSMFSGCSGLTSLNVSGFDTSNVTIMYCMFNGCIGLASLDVSGFDTSNVTGMAQMFEGCSSITSLDVSGFDTSNVTNMNQTFKNCTNLIALDLSKFNTSNVTSMVYMFERCNSITNLNISGFNTSNVMDMTGMFVYMNRLQEISLGENFSFTGNGSTSCTLSTPSSTYITGADGNWYNSAGTAFAPADVPGNVADTYYAASSLVPDPWNAPTLGEGLTPVNWNGTTWVTTDEANWDYNYDIATAGHNTVAGDGTGKWANAQTSDGSLYVWIPRYTYKITSGEHASGNSWSSVDSPGSNKIEVKFSKGTTDDTSNNYKKHPAFTFGTDELEGIWVAKYEASRNDATSDGEGTGTTVSSKPGVVAWSGISVSEMYDYSYNLNRTLESHLMKNSEWGAVAYLTNAIGKIPYINNSYYSYPLVITGYSGVSQDESCVEGNANSYLWNTSNGVKASTTHNVYGIYDMSGANSESVSAYVNYEKISMYQGTSLVSSYETYGSKYVEVYPEGDSVADNYAAWAGITGDTVYETISEYNGNTSWDGDTSNSVWSGYPFFWRGGNSYSEGSAGVFAFGYFNGSGSEMMGFRPVLAIP